MSTGGHFTSLLARWNAGDEEAFKSLVALVYAELRRDAALKARSLFAPSGCRLHRFPLHLPRYRATTRDVLNCP